MLLQTAATQGAHPRAESKRAARPGPAVQPFGSSLPEAPLQQSVFMQRQLEPLALLQPCPPAAPSYPSLQPGQVLFAH